MVNYMRHPMYFDRGYEDYRRRMHHQKENKYKKYLERIGHSIFGKPQQTQDEKIEALIRIIIIITFIYVVIKWIKDENSQTAVYMPQQYGGRSGFESCVAIPGGKSRV